MKKIFLSLVIFVLVAGSLSLFSPNLAKSADSVAAGSLIKGATSPTIYYLAEDGQRYVFPNANTFFSWFEDFKNITVVSDETLASYPLGGNVQYKPGKVLLKIQTDPKVYAVGDSGILRWVKTEALAKALYGSNWNKLIDDLPDSFFTNYRVGDPVAGENDISLADLAAEYPSISHNFGFKAKEKNQNHFENQIEKKCGQLENAVNTLQKRLIRWNMSIDSVGDDFMAECVEKNITTPQGNKGHNKTTLCHKAKETITVGTASVKAHLAHGDTLGECAGETDGKDKTAPVISAVSATAGCQSAAIAWATNEPAASKVYFATLTLASSTNIMSLSDSSLATSHSLSLTGLATSTKYYFKVESKDAAGNTATSTESFFTTLAACADVTVPVISDVSATASTTYATIAWTTNEPSTGKASYSLDPLATSTAIMVQENTSLVASHSLGLTGLATSTKYYFKVESKDAAGNTATSTESFFTTLAE